MLSKCPSFSYVWNHEGNTFSTADDFLCRLLSRDHKQRLIAAYPAIKAEGDKQLEQEGSSHRIKELPWEPEDSTADVDAEEAMLLARIVGPQLRKDIENGLPNDIDSYLDGESWRYPVDRSNEGASVDFAVRCIGSRLAQITPFGVRVGSESLATVIPTPVPGRPAIVFSTSFAELRTWCAWETRRYALHMAGYFGISALYTALLPEVANSIVHRKKKAGERYTDILILSQLIGGINADTDRATSIAAGMQRFIVMHEFGHIHRHDDAEMRNAFVLHKRIPWEERLTWEFESDIQALALLSTREHQIWENIEVVPGTQVSRSLWDEIYWSLALEHFANVDLSDPDKETVAVLRLKNLEENLGITPDGKSSRSRMLKKSTLQVIAYREHLPEKGSIFRDGLNLEVVRQEFYRAAASYLDPASEYTGLLIDGLKARNGSPGSPTLAKDLGLWDGAQEFFDKCMMHQFQGGF